MYNHIYYYSPFMFLGGVLHFFFWVLVIMLIVRLIRGRKHHNFYWGDWGEKSAMHIIRERYAKGEISKEEYEERKKVLEK